MTEFHDFNIKLLALDALLDNGQVVPPYRNGDEWLRASRGIDQAASDQLIFGEYAYRRIPEIEAWARDIEITDAQLATIERLVFDGGNLLFTLMAPSWDGEDELFHPSTWIDVTPQRFPRLALVVYVGEVEPHVRDALVAAGVELQHL